MDNMKKRVYDLGLFLQAIKQCNGAVSHIRSGWVVQLYELFPALEVPRLTAFNIAGGWGKHLCSIKNIDTMQDRPDPLSGARTRVRLFFRHVVPALCP